MELAFAVDEHRDARRSVNFLGELSLSFGRLLRGRAIYEELWSKVVYEMR